MGEHAKYLEWLDLEVEGELAADEGRQLAEHLADCARCREERQCLLALRQALDEARVPVREGFRAEVMASLPAAPWRRPAAAPRRALAAALALLAALAAVSTLLLAGSSGAVDAPGLGVLAALGKMVSAALVTGAGLLGASWAGVGMAVGELFTSAPAVLVGFAVLLVLMSLLLVSLLRHPRGARQAARQRGD